MDNSKKENFRSLKKLIDKPESIRDLIKIIEKHGIRKRDNLQDKFGNDIVLSNERISIEVKKVKKALEDFSQLINVSDMGDASLDLHDLNNQWKKLSYKNSPNNVYIQFGYFKAEFEVYKGDLRLEADHHEGYNLFKSSKPVDKESLPESERLSLLKLVLGMAITKYNFDPDKLRNPVSGDMPGSIRSDLEEIGISIDSDTVRKYLNEANEVIDINKKI